MLDWFRSLFSTFLDALFDALSWFIDNLIATVLTWCMDLAQWGIDLIPDWLGDLNVHARVNDVWQLDAVQLWFYLLPVSECFSIFTAAITIIGTIRAARFIIGLIPTIEG